MSKHAPTSKLVAGENQFLHCVELSQLRRNRACHVQYVVECNAYEKSIRCRIAIDSLEVQQVSNEQTETNQ